MVIFSSLQAALIASSSHVCTPETDPTLKPSRCKHFDLSNPNQSTSLSNLLLAGLRNTQKKKKQQNNSAANKLTVNYTAGNYPSRMRISSTITLVVHGRTRLLRGPRATSCCWAPVNPHYTRIFCIYPGT